MSHIRIILPRGVTHTRARVVKIRRIIEEMGEKCLILQPPLITKELLLSVCADSKDGLDILLSKYRKKIHFTDEELYFLNEGVNDYSLKDALDILLDNPKYMNGVIYHNIKTGVCFAGLVDDYDSIIRRDIMGPESRKMKRRIVGIDNTIHAWNVAPVGNDASISTDWCITNGIKPPKQTRGRGRNKHTIPRAKGKAKGGKEVDDYMYY